MREWLIPIPTSIKSINHLYHEMPHEISLDYVSYLETKWKSHLRKNPCRDVQKRMTIETAVRDALDDMKNQTPVGVMLYNVFYQLLKESSGELKAYALYLRKYR